MSKSPIAWSRLRRKLSFSSVYWLLFALLAGLGCGLIPGILTIASPVADLFLRVLKLLGLPLLFLSLSSTITGIESWKAMRLLGKRTLRYTLITTFLASFLALGIFLILNPAEGVTPATSSYLEVEDPTIKGNYISLLFDMLPSNAVSAFSEGNVIGVVILAFLIGFGSLSLGKKEKEHVHIFFHALFQIVMKVTIVFVRLMPIGIWAFMAQLSNNIKNEVVLLDELGWYVLCILLANLIQGLVILPLFLRAKGVAPFRALISMLPALAVGFSTRSSNAALPSMLHCAEENLKVPKKISRFTLPLCSTINMNGCAAFILTTVLFVSQLHGISFSPASLILWAFLAGIAAVGNAGVPMGCYFLSTVFLNSMGVPLGVMGLILPVYVLIDMVETSLNLWSDSCVTLAVYKDSSKEEVSAL